MTCATIHPDHFPACHPSYSYNGWIVDRLREQGIRFAGLPYLVTPETNVQAHLAPPWRMERNPEDGTITVWQGAD